MLIEDGPLAGITARAALVLDETTRCCMPSWSARSATSRTTRRDCSARLTDPVGPAAREVCRAAEATARPALVGTCNRPGRLPCVTPCS